MMIALECQQTGRMYWLAVLYACAAGDPATAQRYLANVPKSMQSEVLEKCALQGFWIQSCSLGSHRDSSRAGYEREPAGGEGSPAARSVTPGSASSG